MNYKISDLLHKRSHGQSQVIIIISKIMRIYGMGGKDVLSIVNENAHHGDDAVYKKLIHHTRSHIIRKNDGKWSKIRADNRADEISTLLGTCIQVNSVKRMLDIGAGDGVITHAVGTRVFNLSSKNIYGVDIAQWGTNTHNINTDRKINFSFIKDGKIPHPDKSFDCVITMQTLHHVKNLYTMMCEINRVCVLGATVIIREHDCTDIDTSKLIDVEHAMYDIVINKHNADEYNKTYYGKYRSRTQWTNLFESHMFQKIDTQLHNICTGPTKYYYAAYKKIRDSCPLNNYSKDTLRSIHKKIYDGGDDKTSSLQTKQSIIDDIVNIV